MSQPGLIFVTGGSRSGKSGFAEKLALEYGGGEVAYIATATARDEEMQERIRIHRQRRPAGWVTYEETLALPELVGQTGARHPAVLIDCITMWITNLMFADVQDIANRVRLLAQSASDAQSTVIMVSGEVGWGIVADNPLSRQFADHLGGCNQILAAAADDVYAVISGMPLKLKEKGEMQTWPVK